MRVLLIHQYFLEDSDGGGSRWNEMSRIWKSKGHEVTVLAGTVHYMGKRKNQKKGKYFETKINQNGVSVIRCHVSGGYNDNFVGRLIAYFSFTFSSIWAGLFKVTNSYDVVIVTSPPLFVGITGLVLSAFKKVPLIFEIRDLWPESAIDTGVLTNPLLIKFAFWFEKLVYKKATLINVLTPAFKAQLISSKHVDSKKIIYIPNAADFSISEVVSMSFDSQKFRIENNLEGLFVLTYVGAHGIANHLDQLLDAAELLKDTNVLFLLIGDGMQKQKLKAASVERNIDNIRFLDTIPKREVFKYILASDMGISVLKKVDTFKTIYSNKTFDYFSCKKPVLMAIDGISKDLIEKANAGIYVEPENAKDFENKIRWYLKNTEVLKQQGENGYEFAKQHFDREQLATEYIDRIAGLIKS